MTVIGGLWATGGAERLAREITIGLDPDRFERTLCATRWSSEFAADPEHAAIVAQLADAGVRFIGLKRGSRISLSAWQPLMQLLHNGTEVVHSHMFGSNAWSSALTAMARTPVFVAHEHTWSFEGEPIRRLLDRELIARRSDAFVAVSHEDRRQMIEIEGIDPEDVVVVPNGISTPVPSGHDVRAELGISADAPVIGTVANLRPQKALEVLIESTLPLRTEFPGVRVLITGEGPELDRLQAMIGALNLADTVSLLGRRTDVPDVVASMDVAVFSSNFEGSPLSVMECMAAGLPVVATAVGGVPDLIQQGVEGLLVEPRDPAGLAEAVASLLREPEHAREMGARGRERQRAEFSIESTVNRFEDLYLRLYRDWASRNPSRARELAG